MTQQYATVTISLFSLFCCASILLVCSICVVKAVSSDVSLLRIYYAGRALMARKTAMLRTVFKQLFNEQCLFVNYYLAYASSNGTGGGGGGGGHGNYLLRVFFNYNQFLHNHSSKKSYIINNNNFITL
jgi:hypothetical protein